MNYVIALITTGFILALAYGALTKRVQLKNCCVDPNPENDLRMRSAFTTQD